MIEELNIEIIKNTGYITWCDFLMSITGYSLTGEINYSYINYQDKIQSIVLNISHSTLEQLALEEAKILLPMLNINSFTEFMTRIEKENRHYNETYTLEVINRNVDNQITLKKVTFVVKLIERLASIEKMKQDYLFYHDVRKCN